MSKPTAAFLQRPAAPAARQKESAPAAGAGYFQHRDAVDRRRCRLVRSSVIPDFLINRPDRPSIPKVAPSTRRWLCPGGSSHAESLVAAASTRAVDGRTHLLYPYCDRAVRPVLGKAAGYGGAQVSRQGDSLL